MIKSPKILFGALMFLCCRALAAAESGMASVARADSVCGADLFFFYVGIFTVATLPVAAVALAIFFHIRKSKKATATSNVSDEIIAKIQDAARQDSFFNMVLGLIPCQVFIKDASDDFRYKIANKNFTDYYKLTSEDALEHTDFEIFEPEVARQLRAHDKEVCASVGKVFRFDEDISFHRNGIDFFKSLKVCFEENGRHYLLGVCVDITEMVQNEKRLEKTRSLWSLVINALPILIFAKNADDDFRYTIANKPFSEFVGKTPEEIIGKTDKELFSNVSDIDSYIERDHHVMEKSKTENFIEHPYGAHGVQYHMQTIKLPAVAPDGSRLLLGASLDITKLNNMIIMERIKNDVLAQTVSEPDFKRVIEKISNTLINNLHCSRVAFLSYSENCGYSFYHEEHIDDNYAIRADEVSGYEKFWNSQISELEKNVTILCEDISSVPEFKEFIKLNPRCSTKSFGAVSVTTGDKPIGALIISFGENNRLGDLGKHLLLAMGNVIALAAIREEQSRFMRKAQKENQALLDNISIPLWLYDSIGRIIQTNKAADRLLSVPSSDKPFDCKDLLMCEERNSLCVVKNALRDGRTHSNRINFNSKSYIVEANTISGDGGKTQQGVVVSFYDVTALNSVITNNRVINDCLSNLVKESNLHLALEHSIKEICERFG